ncbi:carboxypeptidase-like regulatory domain-containing protein [Aquimarina hainanensis]|uniref:Carboxypeptidase-like regulatory domain-containing protein n=1 Tax=Aquimarina hainanensis TaxID=1578017 RepID=A0ABW5N5F6_9FLAO|nr:carboxypeptidase-like regulatory domain-containing protein [Aquimarina sp. TRL1]QKX04836.1 carboxypeptidase-like regulatory domain-containing protein [Aquimarina sp. TRL1]
MKKITGSLLILFLFLSTISFSQTITSRVIDQKTGAPIPYATIEFFPNEGVITNEEGMFSYTISKKHTPQDSIYISSMGYEKTAVAFHIPIDSIIAIAPKTIELSRVFISNKHLSAAEIIEKTTERLQENYNTSLTHKRLFLRNSDFTNLSKLDVDFKKSTIEEFNKAFVDSVITTIPQKTSYYTEILGDLYGNKNTQKLSIIKAAELYDKNNTGSLEEMGKKIETIFKNNVKKDSYLKFKSGIFSQKVQVDSIIEHEKEAAAVKEAIDSPNKNNGFFISSKSNINQLFSKLFIHGASKLNILEKPGRYHFSLKDYTYIDDNSVYIIEFTPKRRGDFKGTLYINTEDFAVVRIDYENTRLLKSFKLLGLMFQETTYKGKLLFSKNANQKYDLRFMEKITGEKFGVNRPLKIIEKNKFVSGKRKQNELSLGIDMVMSTIYKSELVVFNSENIDQATYDTHKENKNSKPTYLSKYTPEFWEGYNIIEPNTAIKAFKVLD